MISNADNLDPDESSNRAAATVIGAWDRMNLDSIRTAKEAGISRKDYIRQVERLQQVRDTKIQHLLNSLDPEEKKWVLEIIRDMQDAGDVSKSAAYKAIWELDFKYRPVSIEQFLEDDYYLKASAESLFECWKKVLSELFAPGAGVVETYLGGAIGGGKTYCGAIIISYLLYKMSCLINPQKFYGLSPNSHIYYGIYGVSKTQVQDVGYDKLRMFLDSSPYFREKFPLSQHIQSKIVFPGAKISVVGGSREVHAIGRDLYAILGDELNFMGQVSSRNKDPDAKGQAEALYDSCQKRIYSRFMQSGGHIPGMIVLCSSVTSQNSFMEERKKKAKDKIAEGTIKVYEFAQWEAWGPTKFTQPEFYVEVGDRIHPSKVLKARTPEEAAIEGRPGSIVRGIPGDVMPFFLTDVEMSLREIAGVATYGMSPLFKQRFKIEECITEQWQHPFTRDEITISDEDDTLIDEYFVPERMFKVVASHNQPRLNPQCPRFIHLDIALTGDSFGIACGHLAGLKEVRKTKYDGTYYFDYMPEVYIDFMLRIKPPDNGEIDIGKVRSFIISLRDQGLPIRYVGCDGYQSRDNMQVLRHAGFESGTYSVDKTDEAYMGLKQAIYDRRISYYRHEHFIKELVHLERDLDTKTVDHPEKFTDGEKGSKDVSDCVAAVVMACLTLPEAGDSTGLIPPPVQPAPSDSIITAQRGTPQVDAAREQLKRMRRNG